MTATLPAGWKPISSAPKDGTEILAWRSDCGQFIASYTSADSFPMTQDELDAYDEATLFAKDWFTQWPDATRLDGSEAPTLWQPLPAEPCQTCNDQGAVGNVLTAESCPDCTPPASAQPESMREGYPHDNPQFIALCREHDILGTAMQGLAAVFWRAASAQDDAKDERQAFEAWAKKKKMPLARIGEQYDDFWVDHAWNGWQARAALAAPAAGDARDAARYRTVRKSIADEGNGANQVAAASEAIGLERGSYPTADQFDEIVDHIAAQQSSQGEK